MHARRHWIEKLPYRIEVFDKPDEKLIEVLARVSDLDMAGGLRRRVPTAPGSDIELALKVQVLRRSGVCGLDHQ